MVEATVARTTLATSINHRLGQERLAANRRTRDFFSLLPITAVWFVILGVEICMIRSAAFKTRPYAKN